jgi:hypothetical protein
MMSESQIPTDLNPPPGNIKRAGKKGINRLIGLLLIGVNLILFVVIYKTLFPKVFWQARELEQNQVKWESQQITHYRISIDLPGFGDYYYDQNPITFEVKDDKVILILNAQGETISLGDSWNYGDFTPKTYTIPGLFAYADQKIRERPPLIRISYDPSLGYPTQIYLVPWREPCCQDFTFTVADFPNIAAVDLI